MTSSILLKFCFNLNLFKQVSIYFYAKLSLTRIVLLEQCLSLVWFELVLGRYIYWSFNKIAFNLAYTPLPYTLKISVCDLNPFDYSVSSFLLWVKLYVRFSSNKIVVFIHAWKRRENTILLLAKLIFPFTKFV